MSGMTAVDLRQSCKVLVADDDSTSALRIRRILESGGYRQTEALSHVESFAQLEGHQIVIMDIVWPRHARPEDEKSDYFGLAGLRYLRTHDPESRVVLMSRWLFDLDHINEIQQADAYFKSTTDADQILRVITQVLHRKQGELMPQNSETQGLVLMRLPAGVHTAQPPNQRLVVYDYLSLLEQTLLDGRADLFGLRSDSYQELVKEVRELKVEVQNRTKPPGAWRKRFEALGPLASGAKNLLDLVQTILKLLPH
jgi:CheY-like chemotaxis protein